MKINCILDQRDCKSIPIYADGGKIVVLTQ
jgi:hypothetical protein